MTESQPAVGICADPVRDERFGFSKRLPLSIRILLVMERRIRRPPGSLPGAAIATVVGAVVIVALFGYLFRGASVWATVDGPVQEVRNGSDYDYRAVVEYRPREDVADLCRDSGVCRAMRSWTSHEMPQWATRSVSATS
jgi:hypothetical protein